MYLKSIELSGFKSFAKKCELTFTSPIAAIVGPNGSGKSNTAEAFRFVLGEQSMKTMRGKRGPDLIWSGNERTPQASRARVAVTFDNRKQLLDIDFDEVVIERIVYRDGANEYAINGSRVRLKDIHELLSGAKIGASGHHIISQGEADRILGASEKERREIIEEALGLKVYQYKKTESERKLERTAENMKEVSILRREIAPHLTFLERQMKKLERSRELKQALITAYAVYIAHERARIVQETQRLTTARVQPEQQLRDVSSELQEQKEPEGYAQETAELRTIDTQIQECTRERSSLEHSRGRIEGQIALVEKTAATHTQSRTRAVPFAEVETFLGEVEDDIRTVQKEGDISLFTQTLARFSTFLNQFRSAENVPEPQNPELLKTLTKELDEVREALATLAQKEAALDTKRADALRQITEKQEGEKEAQRRYFQLKEQKRDIERILEDIQREETTLARVRERLTDVEYKVQDLGAHLESETVHQVRTQEEQENAMREIERIEARLEESGIVDEDTVREYEDTQKRDAFLERELEDLEASKQTLLDIIASLDAEIATRFEDGLKKINEEFQNFFAMLFDGGSASLKLVKKVRTTTTEDGEEVSEQEVKEGIEVRVQLPRKKVNTLDVLSGGERALTSIALIFAMSQVNPPPFIILDETDAALDEANSRKYAQMVRTLSERSQLILITHNRQTMEAAGELYGVTMGSDGISKLLSVKFEDALSVAK